MGWLEDGDHEYLIIPEELENNLNWSEASQACKENRADLISINSKDTSDTLYEWVRKFVCLRSKFKCWHRLTIAIV